LSRLQERLFNFKDSVPATEQVDILAKLAHYEPRGARLRRAPGPALLSGRDQPPGAGPIHMADKIDNDLIVPDFRVTVFAVKLAIPA
jgi:hypothetical protein